MEAIVRRYMGAVDLVAVSVVAVIAAHATSHVADAALVRLSEDEGTLSTAPPSAPNDQGNAPDVAAIVRRNIFCSSCMRSTKAGGEDEGPSIPSSLRLLAIMYAAPPADPGQSIAVIKDEGGATGAYVAGAAIGAATVDVIDELHVWLRLSDGRRQVLTLLEGMPTPVSAPPPDPLVAELDAGIQKLGDNHYGVSRATVESLLGKMDGLPAQARIEPAVDSGKAIGFRLRDVKAGGVFAKIGLRDGDLIDSVNGLATNGPDNALAIYTSLRSVDHLSVALERAGRHITAEYDIE
jgi:general secretion pathway protein C